MDFGVGFSDVANFVEQALAVVFAFYGRLANADIGLVVVVRDRYDVAGVSGIDVAVVISGAGCHADVVQTQVARAIGIDCAGVSGFKTAGWWQSADEV